MDKPKSQMTSAELAEHELRQWIEMVIWSYRGDKGTARAVVDRVVAEVFEG